MIEIWKVQAPAPLLRDEFRLRFSPGSPTRPSAMKMRHSFDLK